MKRTRILSIALLIASSLLYGQPLEAITFQGGHTKASMKEGRQVITLSEGAHVASGNISIQSKTVELSGSNFRDLKASGKVEIIDTENKIVLTGSTLYYNRETKNLRLEGWVELQDYTEEVLASGGYLEYDEPNQTLLLQIGARLLRHTDSGPLICRGDYISFDRQKMLLIVSGNPSLSWKGDTYQADIININLETEEIVLEGSIRGTVHGK